jgi:hypothetical protein
MRAEMAPRNDRQYLLERLQEIAIQADLAGERLLHNGILLVLQVAALPSFKQRRLLAEAGALIVQVVKLREDKL